MLTVSGLAKVAIFTTNVDSENQTLINHKCVCGALNRHFCQTRVIRCPSCLSWVTVNSLLLFCRLIWVKLFTSVAIVLRVLFVRSTCPFIRVLLVRLVLLWCDFLCHFIDFNLCLNLLLIFVVL